MFKLLTLVVIGFILAGCASTSLKPVDKQCDEIGLYARSVVTRRDVGMSLSDINAQTFRNMDLPYLGINSDAYTLKTKTPADAYIVFYQMCVSVGYDLTVKTFRNEELIRSYSISRPSAQVDLTLTTEISKAELKRYVHARKRNRKHKQNDSK